MPEKRDFWFDAEFRSNYLYRFPFADNIFKPAMFRFKYSYKLKKKGVI